MGDSKRKHRVIFHVDMNSFYASVEMAFDPSLKGKAIAVAGNPKERKGIIVTCSYEARKYGVKTTMPIWEAKKLCPQLLILPPNFDRYRAASIGLFTILRQYTHLVEPVSIDEGYMDVSDYEGSETPIELAQSIQTRLIEQLDLPCSIGIAPNKFLAKMASDMKKPNGITILRKRELSQTLWPLPVVEMHGIGKKTAEKLNKINIFTIEELANADDLLLKVKIGINGLKMKNRANGIDERLVDPESILDFKSIGNSMTLPRDVANQQELLQHLAKLSEKVANRMKNKKMVSSNIAIQIRYKDWVNVTRTRKIANPIRTKKEIFQMARVLFIENWSGDSIRLLGVTAHDLIDESEAFEQLDLFSYAKHAKTEPLVKIVQEIQKKYGSSSLTKGISIKSESGDQHDTSFNKDFLFNPSPPSKGNEF
jgi:DNA polymerase-4